MKRLIAMLLFALGSLLVSAQAKEKSLFVGRVVSDSATFKSGRHHGAALSSILKSKNKIEIRLITSSAHEDTNYITLAYNKRWVAKRFDYNSSTATLSSKNINKKANIDIVFSRLVLNNIFSLPDQDSLKTERLVYDPTTNEFVESKMSVSKGNCYWIEFKVGDHCRCYSYCNPEEYADFYPLVYELRNFVNIVNIFNELTKE